MRVVSLACSNTEIVHALGCAERLVGVDDHSDFPELLVARLPRLGPDLDPDLDRVAALEPDLVLATLTVPGHERVVEALARRGVPFLAPEPVSLEDVYRDIVEIAGRLGVPERAGPLIAEMRAELSAPPPPADAPSVLIEWWPKPVIAPGRRNWATDVLHAAGARGLLEDEEGEEPAPGGRRGAPARTRRVRGLLVRGAAAEVPAGRRAPESRLGGAPRGARGTGLLRPGGLPRAGGSAAGRGGAGAARRGGGTRRAALVSTKVGEHEVHEHRPGEETDVGAVGRSPLTE